MSDDPPPDGPDTRRVALALLCVLGLVAAAGAAPAIAGQTPLGGLDAPTQPSDVPSFLRNADFLRWLFGGDAPESTGGPGQLFGALSLSDSTSIGGPVSAKSRQEAASPHFVATASKPGYWRTGAYVDYTGSGWEDQGESEPLRTMRTSSSGLQDGWFDVTLRKPATALPVQWRPRQFQPDCTSTDGACDNAFFVTSTMGLKASSPLQTGASYRFTTTRPTRDPAVLGRTPVQFEDPSVAKYTAAETPNRVRQLSDRITADASNRYEAAKAIERWLEEHKTYSLTDVPEPGDHVTEQFLFDQEKGYCEYFATAMTVMLRTQDVPARYVVGYAGGEQVGDDRYLVRGADAHAWVEVYFQDVGWVRFDPTPSEPRQAADDRLRQGSKTFRVQLNESATPGERVTATVTTAGLPASGVNVVVNGEVVGETDEDGEVAFVVPYADELRVRVAPPLELKRGGTDALAGPDRYAKVAPPSFTNWDTSAGPTTSENGSEQTFPVDSDVRFSVQGDVEPGTTVRFRAFVGSRPFPNASVSVAGERVGRTDDEGFVRVRVPSDASGVIRLTAARGSIEETETYPVDALSVSVSPSLVAPVPWTGATATVTAGGDPVVDAVVRVNGERVGKTDDSGRVHFEIPLARAPSVSVSASEKSATTYVDGVLPTVGVVVLAALGALGAVVTALRRQGLTVRDVAAGLSTAANRAVAAAVGAVVGLADAVDELVAEFRTAARDGWRGVLEWLASLPSRVPDLGSLVAALGRVVQTDESGSGVRDDAVSAGTTSESSTGRLQAVWRRFVARVGVDRWKTKTPGEVARAAVARGFPSRPVYALTNAFRDAAYGGRGADARAEDAESALRELDGGPDGDGSTDAGGDGT